MKFSITDFFSNQNPRGVGHIYDEILNGKLHFFCAVYVISPNDIHIRIRSF